MLEDLDKIDWAQIRHSHGTAEQFLVWLRALATDSDEAWLGDPDLAAEGEMDEDSAFYNIAEFSNHQGSIYQVTPYVAPFLIELLQAFPHRAELIIGVLANYAEGYPIFNEDNHPLVKKHYEDRGESFSQKISDAAQWVSDTKEILRSNVPLFIPYLRAGRKSLRWSTASLLGNFRDDPRVQEAIAEAKQSEQDPNILKALSKL